MNPSFDARAAILAIEKALSAGDLNAAEKSVTNLLAEAPGNPAAYYFQSILHWQRNRHADAIQWLRRAEKAAPTEPRFPFELSQMLHAMGDPDGAIEAMRRTAELAPSAPEPIINLGALQLQAGQHADAAATLEMAARSFPARADAHFNLGVAFKHLGRLGDAREAYAKAAALDPANPQYQFALGNLLIEVQAYGEAVDVLAPLSRQHPNELEIVERLGFAPAQTGDAKAAGELHARILAAQPDNVPIRQRLMYNQMQLGDWPGAADNCRRILAADPGNIATLGYRKFIRREAPDETADDGADIYAPSTWVRTMRLPTPPGFASLAAFNEQLSAEILDAARRQQPAPAISLHNGKIVSNLKDCEGDAIAALVRAIEETVGQYIPGYDAPFATPWTARRPAAWETYIWSTVLQSEGFQNSHMHPSAWLSGVYYARLPSTLGGGDGHDGWLEFGRAPERLATTQTDDVDFVEPEAGLLVLFPSYLHHRTVPFTSDDRRISIAFDCEPKPAGA